MSNRRNARKLSRTPPSQQNFDQALVTAVLTWAMHRWEEFSKELGLEPEQDSMAKARLSLIISVNQVAALSTRPALEYLASKEKS
jgi:hypothetical protein